MGFSALIGLASFKMWIERLTQRELFGLRDFSSLIALWAAFSFSVLVAVLVNTATKRDCPEQHPADTAGVRTDEHVKEQEA